MCYYLKVIVKSELVRCQRDALVVKLVEGRVDDGYTYDVQMNGCACDLMCKKGKSKERALLKYRKMKWSKCKIERAMVGLEMKSVFINIVNGFLDSILKKEGRFVILRYWDNDKIQESSIANIVKLNKMSSFCEMENGIFYDINLIK